MRRKLNKRKKKSNNSFSGLSLFQKSGDKFFKPCPLSGKNAPKIDYKDIKSNALKFLENEGNPYHFIGVDENGKIGLEFGVFGLPETFLTNNKGEIVFKHTGPLTLKIIQNEIITRLQ